MAITLTDAGRAALADILPAARNIEAELRAAAGPKDLVTFFQVMERMHDVLDADPDARPRSQLDLDGTAD